MRSIKFSLVLPCFNEEEHIKSSANTILQTLVKNNLSFEIIIVEDKSTDDTLLYIKEFIRQNNYKHLHLVEHEVNLGRGKSVADGFRKARGEYVGYIDIDCEISPKYISSCIKELENGYDLVYGNRSYEIGNGVVRALASKIYHKVMQFILNTKLQDTETGYKFFRRTKILKILPMVKNKKWFWDTEVMIRAEKNGLKIKPVFVQFHRRMDKTSTVHLVHDSLEYIYNLISFKITLLKEEK